MLLCFLNAGNRRNYGKTPQLAPPSYAKSSVRNYSQMEQTTLKLTSMNLFRFSLKLLIYCLFFPVIGEAQIRPMVSSSTTRAVIIGVSKFQYEKIPPLQFAHRDAIAMADFLSSESGGNLAPEHYKLLVNEQATQGQMAVALTWLIEETREGDRAIIYFSGHGDMESQTYSKRGYLLTYDTHPTTYMAGGAFPLTHIHDVIETLRKSKGAEVILITDACHAGALAGAENKGAQATNYLLAEQTADVKLLSCQQNEYSAEGRQWGGGHGVFTYYLIDGLIGLADRDEDNIITLFELKRYLEDEVRIAVAPRAQNPNIGGNPATELALVNLEALAVLREKREGTQSAAQANPKGIRLRSAVLQTDSTIWELYQAFNLALNRKHYLYPSNGSAYSLYIRLKNEAAIQPYEQEMRLQLVAALQDEAQQAINDYLAANPAELRRRWAASPVYQRYPQYLKTAADLLGEAHFMHQDLQTKALYFEGLNIRLVGEDKMANSSLFTEAIAIQERVLLLDTTAAYAYNELGLLARRTGRFTESIRHFDQALAFSPTWVLAIANRCASLVDNGNYTAALSACTQALTLDSTFSLAHHNLGAAFKAQENWSAAIAAFDRAIAYDPLYALSYSSKGDALYFSNEKIAAKAAWQQAFTLDSSRLFDLYNIGIVERELGNYAPAIQAFRQYLRHETKDADAYQEIGIAAMLMNDFEQAATALAQSDALAPQSAETYYLLASLAAVQAQKKTATQQLTKAIEYGFTDFERLRQDPLWQQIIGSNAIKKLLD